MRIYKVGVHTHTHTDIYVLSKIDRYIHTYIYIHTFICIYMCYPRYIQYALRRRALNAVMTAKSWPHKYIFNAEWNLVQGFHSNYKIFF